MSIHWGGRGAGHISRWSIAPTGAPALDLNFLSGTLDSRISFSRTSPATVINASGAIETSPANTPRFDFDPVTLTQRGLLIEEPRTNLLTTSLINGVPLVTQSVSVTAVPHTLSFYGTGTVTLSGASVATVVGTGVYPNRRTITFTPILGVLVCTVVGIVQFAQLEVGSFATSFIPTTASTVTRSADVATMTGTNFSSWYNQSEGAFVVNGSRFSTADFSAIASANDGTITNEIYVGPAGSTASAYIRSTAGAGGDMTGAAWANNTVGIAALAYQLNNAALSFNGAAAIPDTTVGIPTVNQLSIGLRTANYLNGHIRRIAYYNTRLPNAHLQTLTV